MVTSNTLTRLLSAVPDTLTAMLFLIVWVAPLHFGESSVRNGMLIMLVEFILVHASGFIGAQLLGTRKTSREKFLFVAGFGLFYLIFISAWAWSFRQWWPFLAFGWLLVGKFTTSMDARLPSDERKLRMQSDWALGALAYIGGVFATILLPVPRLGITPDIISQLDLPGGGMWIDEPQRVIAFGVIYFGVLAWVKFKNYALPGSTLPKRSRDKQSVDGSGMN